MREKRLMASHNVGKFATLLSCEYLDTNDQLSWSTDPDTWLTIACDSNVEQLCQKFGCVHNAFLVIRSKNLNCGCGVYDRKGKWTNEQIRILYVMSMR